MTKEAKYFKPCSICHNDECVWIGTKDTHLICEDYKSQDGDCINKQAVLDIDFNRICVTTAKPAEMIRNKINNLPSVQPKPKTEWIPISEKLPESECLLCDNIGLIFIGSYSKRYKWFEDYNENIIDDVVAWMPLPPSYQGGMK